MTDVTKPEVSDSPQRKEIYTYDCAWATYGLSWGVTKHEPFRFAVSSFIQQYANRVSILTLDDDVNDLVRLAGFDHPYPATKIMFSPDRNGGTDLMATTGDYLRLWEITGSGAKTSVSMKSVLKNNKKSDFCAPLTSFDWNVDDPRLLGTSSIDTTCSIWDVEAGTPTTQLIAHDKEVFDIAFAKGKDVFGSVGADGSVRLFDLRSLQHSTIIYESPDLTPVLRISWNKQDPNYLACANVDSSSIVILDMRVPSSPVAVLTNHTDAANSIQWAPHSSCHMCSAGDDSQALIWDVSALPNPVEDPILAYTADAEINCLTWCAQQTDWVGISYDTKVQVLRV